MQRKIVKVCLEVAAAVSLMVSGCIAGGFAKAQGAHDAGAPVEVACQTR